MIKRCTCKHSYQDKIHGKGMRVFNPIKVENKVPKGHRCTVCRHEVLGKS